MTNLIVPSADIEDKLHAAFSMPEPRASFVEGLLKQIQKTPSPVRMKRSIWQRPSVVFAMLVMVVLSTIFLLIGPQKVIAAARNWLNGYLPGFGFVTQTTDLRAIQSPVHQERDGATLTIDQAFTDSQRTIIVIGESQNSQPCPSPMYTTSTTGMQIHEPFLLVGSERFELQGWQASYMYFQSIPAQIKKVVLYVPYMMFCESDESDWAVPLVFAPVPEGTVMPVIENAPSEVVVDPTLTPATSLEPTQSFSEQFSLNLENVVKLQEGVLLSGLLSWSDEFTGFDVPNAEEIILFGADGQNFPLTSLLPEEVWALYPELPANSIPWAYRLLGDLPETPVSLQFPYLLRSTAFQPDQHMIKLDLGSNPQPGQVWKPDLTIQVSGHDVHITEVHAMQSPDVALEFVFETDENVTMLAVADDCFVSPGGFGCGGGGTINVVAPGQLVCSFFFDQGIPAGEQTFYISYLEERVNGPWTFTWTENAAP